jgi:hypothetical protein
MVLRHNWDYGPPAHIVSDPQCDYGTALFCYWAGGPGYMQQFAKVSDDDAWLRRRSGSASRSRSASSSAASRPPISSSAPRFDRTTLSTDGYDWTAQYADVTVVRPIPEALKEPSVSTPRGKRAAKSRSATRPVGCRDPREGSAV